MFQTENAEITKTASGLEATTSFDSDHFSSSVSFIETEIYYYKAFVIYL